MTIQLMTDLERIFEAAMQDKKYSDALKAKCAQYKIIEGNLKMLRLKNLDDETLKRLLEEEDDE